MLRSQSEAEDAVQSAFLRAWRNRHTCRTPDAPLPWLLQITRNEALRLLRQNARGGIPVEDVVERADDGREAIDVASRVDVGRALEGLSHDDRRLLELRYTHDLTQPAVAAELGLPEGTVKVRLHRLRLRLRVALEVQP